MRSRLLALIQESDAPLKATDLVKRAGLQKKVTGKAAQAGLDAGLKTNQIFNWGTAATPLYWHRGPEQEARERLLSLAANELVEEASAKSRAMAGPPKLSKALVNNALKILLKEPRLRLVVSPPGSKKKRLVDLEHPQVYLSGEIARLLQDFGLGKLSSRIEQLFVGQDAREAPTPVGEAEIPRGEAHTPKDDATAGVAEVAGKMLATVNRIAFSPGTTVTFYRLRQQPEMAHIQKEIFDKAALLLEQERKVFLSIHGHAPALPAEEREKLVTNGLGTYYVSIYTR